MQDKRLVAQAIKTKRENNPPHWEIIDCYKDGLDTEEGKSRLEKLQAEAIKARPLQEVNFICLVGIPDG